MARFSDSLAFILSNSSLKNYPLFDAYQEDLRMVAITDQNRSQYKVEWPCCP
jgi:hypothetical protein